MDKKQLNIGFIGTGIMGTPMIKNLIRAGYPVQIFSRHEEKTSELSVFGAVAKNSVSDVAASSHVIITMLGFPSEVEAVYFGENGILNHAAAESHIIDMTTGGPKLAEKIYDAAREKGIHALDAPVTGGEKGAIEGTLSIMVGGNISAYDSCHELLSAMGRTIVYMGTAGSGQNAKLSNQIMIAGIISGICEGLGFASRCGLDMEKWFEIVSKGGASSRQLNNVYPKIQSGNDKPGFKIKHFIKDMMLAKEMAEKMELHLPVLEQALTNYQELQKKGYGESGTQALIHQYTGGQLWR